MVDHRVRRVLQRTREIHPGHKGAVVEDWIRQAVRRDMRERTEEQTEDDHGHKRLQDSPRGPDGRLLVTDFQVAPYEKIEQFAELPQLGQIGAEPMVRGPNRGLNCCVPIL